MSFLEKDNKSLVFGGKLLSHADFVAVRPSVFSCRMVGLQYELALVSHPEKDVLYPPFSLDMFGNPWGRGFILLPPQKCDGLALLVPLA